MSRDLSTGVSDALEDDVIYPFLAIELQFDGNNVVRLWSGVGTLVFQGNSWVGAGELLKVSSVEETSEMSAKGATVNLSGVPEAILSLALTEPYQGRVGKIYFGLFTVGSLEKENGLDYILLQNGDKILLETQETSLTEVFSGYMDTMHIDETPENSTITLTIENKLVTLERPRVARYTHEFQKTIDSTDKGLEYVESIQLKEFVWGPNG